MVNNSATGGYITPNAGPPTPLEDAALENFFQAVIVGLTGLPGNMVFPRWQATPPLIPPITSAWASVGIIEAPADTYAYEIHDPAANGGAGQSYLARNEQLGVLCSFYGPSARGLAGVVRDGLQIGQNREALQLAGMTMTDCGDTLSVPALINNQWYSRIDMTVRFRRAVVRTYPILNLLSASISLAAQPGITDTINVGE